MPTATTPADIPPFLTARHLERIYGGRRSIRSCQRDYNILREVLKVGPYLPGIPLARYAEYVGVPKQDIIDALTRDK